MRARWSPSARPVCGSPGTATTSCATIRERTGVAIEVIPGEEESRLAYLAVLAGLGLRDEPVVVFDTGGGSTQVTFGRGTRVDERFSVEVGAVRFTEAVRPRGGGVGAGARPRRGPRSRRACRGSTATSGPRPCSASAARSPTSRRSSIALAVYDPDVVQGTILGRDEIDRQIELYRTRDAEARRSIVGLQPKRADVILAGALIVRTVMDKLGSDALTVSDRGLRHGVLAERFGN